MTKESVTVKSDFSKLFMQFPVGGLRVEYFIASQQKNYDAFTKATQLAAESWGLVINRQAELARKAAEDSSNTVRQLFNGAAPQEKLALQADFVKDSFEKGVAGFREVSDLIVKANTEAADVIAKRVTEGLAEIKGAVIKS
jgi:phasin family protein